MLFKEMIVFKESTQRNAHGDRKIEIWKHLYLPNIQPIRQKIRICNNMNLAEKYCINQGWGKHGYSKNIKTGEINYLA